MLCWISWNTNSDVFVCVCVQYKGQRTKEDRTRRAIVQRGTMKNEEWRMKKM